MDRLDHIHAQRRSARLYRRDRILFQPGTRVPESVVRRCIAVEDARVLIGGAPDPEDVALFEHTRVQGVLYAAAAREIQAVDTVIAPVGEVSAHGGQSAERRFGRAAFLSRTGQNAAHKARAVHPVSIVGRVGRRTVAGGIDFAVGRAVIAADVRRAEIIVGRVAVGIVRAEPFHIGKVIDFRGFQHGLTAIHGVGCRRAAVRYARQGQHSHRQQQKQHDADDRRKPSSSPV